jgi:murein DD-endopeptidase MepM/ murein hydrolase activator NlpD
MIVSRWFDKIGGNCVIFEIKYGNHRIKLGYAHLDKLPDPSITRVKADDIIAYSGNTGLTTGPHLHYTMRIDDQLVDPALYHSFNAASWPDSLFNEKETRGESNARTETALKPGGDNHVIIFS